MTGKSGAADTLAVLVQRHQQRFFRNRGGNRRCLFRDPGRGVAGAAFRNFMNLEAAKAELAADIVEPRAIAFGEFTLRSLLEAADGNDEQAHEGSGKAS